MALVLESSWTNRKVQADKALLNSLWMVERVFEGLWLRKKSVSLLWQVDRVVAVGYCRQTKKRHVKRQKRRNLK